MRVLSQLGFFSEQVPIVHNKKRENCVSLFHNVFSVNFFKEGRWAKEGKVTNCTHTLPLRKTSEKGTEKSESYQQLLQILTRWIYHGVMFSTKNDRLKRLWNNSQTLKITPPRGKTKINYFRLFAFSISKFSLRTNTPQDFSTQPSKRSVFVVEWE